MPFLVTRGGRRNGVFVAASTDCFPDLPLDTALERLVDLEFSRIEIALNERGNQLRPSQVLENLEGAIAQCRETHRLKPVAYNVDLDLDSPAYYEQFSACCKLAKATKVVSISVAAGEIGTPFNAEIERLRELARIALLEGVLVGIRTEIGRMTQDPATAVVLCDNVKGLGLCLDPSHYVCGPYGGAPIDPLLKYVYHVRLRDSTKDKLQVRVGQGSVEYGRLVAQLSRVRYDRALAVHITPMPDLDHAVEMRKMRLLLESLL